MLSKLIHREIQLILVKYH